MATGRDILEAKEHIADSAEENIILDISCMPKRIFFPILKFLILDESVRNLAVAYSVPENYPAGDLAHDPLEWAQLPTYSRVEAMPDTGSASVIVGVGFSPFQLPSLLDEHYKDSELSLLFPFPPGPPQFQRNWAFVGEVKWWYPRLTDDNILRIHAYDTPRCYDTIKGLLTDESESVIFAPFGPKPHSLAMCVYAINHDSDVFYTQPQIYSPDYSRGMQRNADGTPKCIGYLVKYEGELLYS
ncbi:MAG: hypothetical protein GVY36_16110 [Verrucomicrobia bacterium]|jgi:hypothetical protein|nr:hypothetical protein [Verrucomicrobiota bacterium]